MQKRHTIKTRCSEEGGKAEEGRAAGEEEEEEDEEREVVVVEEEEEHTHAPRSTQCPPYSSDNHSDKEERADQI
jgi:hypothetical protein